MRRVVVFGYGGSGKSTLAREIGRRLGLPYFETDALHWNPGWAPTPREAFRRKVLAATDGEAWVTEGNYGAIRDILLGRADTVVWLDYPMLLASYRLLARTARRIVRQEAVCNGNRETFRGAFLSRDSILLYVLRARWRALVRGERYEARWAPYPHLQVIRHRLPGETAAWLRTLGG